jgi:hypothetical protein
MLKRSKLLLLLFSFLALTGIVYILRASDQILLSGYFGNDYVIGSFSTGGNAGIVTFDDTPPGYSGAEITGFWGAEITLTGIFWMQTVGWTTFWESPVTLIPPVEWENVRDLWYLSGYAWSPNAGWIALNHGESSASGVAFFPDTKKLVGFGWNDALGWIPFGEMYGSGIDVEVSEWFIGKVNIVWSIWGSKTFNVLYDVGGSFNTTSMLTFVNVVRKNVTILLRNATSRVNTNLSGTSPVTFNNAMIFRTEDNPSAEFLTYSTISTAFDNDLARSLIVIGADIYIDLDVISPALLSKSRAIIALRNDKGQWGNIWIKGSVKNIESMIFAEKTIYSGEEFITGSLSPYYVSKKSLFLDIPRNQLYIKGTVWGYNTIGWSSKADGAICPYLGESIENCTYDSAIKYDWNYFRVYNGTPARRAYPDASKDDYSVIIEYDPRTLQDPPPWLETLN